MKCILIDGRFIGVGDSIGRYTLELLANILELDRENEYTLLVRPAGLARIQDSGFRIKLNKRNLKIEVLDVTHYSFAEQTKFLSYLNHKKYDLVHFTQFNHPVGYKGKYVVTIHDLILLEKCSITNWPKQIAFRHVMANAIKESEKVIAISKLVKNDIIDKFKPKEDKIEVIYHGIDHEMFNLESKAKTEKLNAFKEQNQIAGEYLLYTGAWKKHKNLQRLFKSFEKVLNNQKKSGIVQNLQLVLVGKIDQDEPEISAEISRINEELGSKAILPVGPRFDQDLVMAYAGALTYVIPSLAEGFGWPPLEAMACGTPVIASNASCIPEILGDAAEYFDPHDTNSIAESIEKIVQDGRLRSELTEKGLVQSAKYNWAETAQKTLQVYRDCLTNI
ncbi:MAG: glycosyltransferase family 1 protein [Candidatus Berkelbacteria bacterium]|nr:glycosyltransferase family 1 protein [Candidatus Berkelbacteria bacterium]